jgi:hypothetical protein
MICLFFMDDALQRSMERAVEVERTRLAGIERVREFVKGCDADQLRFLREIFGGDVNHHPKSEAPKLEPAPAIKSPESEPTTDRAAPRRRWGVLFPAVVKVIEGMDEITSVNVREKLKAANFKFSSARAVSSISAVLRQLEYEGALREVSKPEARPVVYKKDPRALKATVLRKRISNPGGRLAVEVIRTISTVPVPFTTVQIIEKLKREGFKFDTETPGSSINAVFARLVKRDQIRLLSKGTGPRASTYERTAKWGGGARN